MGFKMGVIVGAGVGYYFGARAGRERYEQLNRWADKAKQTDAYNAASEKARDLAGEGFEKAKDLAVDSMIKAREQAKDGVAAAKDELSSDDEPDPDMHLPTQGFSNN